MFVVLCFVLFLSGRSNERRIIGWGAVQWEPIYDMVEFMVDCCSEKKDTKGVVAGKWFVVNAYLRRPSCCRVL